MKKLSKKNRMRVAVARDVIAQVRAKKYVATHGCYIAFVGRSVDIMTKKDPSAEKLQTILNEKLTKRSCQVCGIGAVLISKVRKFDGLSGNPESLAPHEMIEACAELFDFDEMKEIERAFEGWGSYVYDDGINPDDRLVAIMRSIVTLVGKIDREDIQQRIAKLRAKARKEMASR